jgi:hypothetical protein
LAVPDNRQRYEKMVIWVRPLFRAIFWLLGPVKVRGAYRMPKDVSDWIDNASARITYLTTTVERLKQENKDLRAANKVMEARVLGNSQE